MLANHDRRSVLSWFDSTGHGVPYMFSHIMAAANASARGQRVAILASPLSELTGFNLTVDCLSPGCARERTFAVADLATFYGGGRTRRVALLGPDARE